jgi:hypothetical protein
MALTPQPAGVSLLGVFRIVPCAIALLALVGCSSPRRPFSCDRAAELLGQPRATVGPCEQVLPGVWRVVLRAPGIGPGDTIIRSFTWHGGRLEERGGQPHLARTLAAIDAHRLPAVSSSDVQVLLEATGALPPGFAPWTLDGVAGDLSAAVRTKPFGLRLVMENWRLPEPQGSALGQPPRPTSPGPLGPAPGTAPPGGFAPPSVGLADLELDGAYRGRWRVQERAPFAQSFREVLTVPVGPE